MAVEGSARVLKYLLFIFNLLFLLAGLALIIIGAVATAKLTPYSTVAGVHFNGVGVFLIVIGFVVFLISFFGCLGAYKENYCLLIVFIVLMVVTLLLLIAAVITAFVMRNQVTGWITDGFDGMIKEYKKPDNKPITDLWDAIQKDMECCGSRNNTDWLRNEYLNQTSSTPDSCCKTVVPACGDHQANPIPADKVYTKGCSGKVSDSVFSNVVAVGGAAVAIGILMLIGIIFASCLATAIRKDYGSV